MAKTGMSVVGSNVMQRRLLARVQRIRPDGPMAQAALNRIGVEIVNLAIDNLTRQGAVDTGVLRASLKHRVETSQEIGTVLAGAFGVRYARMVEYGGAFTEQMRRAMFAAFRERGRGQRAGKGVISGGYYKARPYLGPAFQQVRQFVLDEFSNVVRVSRG